MKKVFIFIAWLLVVSAVLLASGFSESVAGLFGLGAGLYFAWIAE